MIDIDLTSNEPDPSKLRFTKTLRNMIISLFGLIILGIGLLFGVYKIESEESDFRGVLGELQFSTSQIMGHSTGAMLGQVKSFQGLNELIVRMDEQWVLLHESAPERSDALLVEMREVKEVWDRIRHNTQVVIQNEDDVLLMRDMAITIREALPRLQAEHSNLVEIYLDIEASAEQVSLASRQSWFAERIGQNLEKILLGGSAAQVAADKFYSDASRFGKVLESMKNGNRAMGIAKTKNKAALKSLKKSTELYGLLKGLIKDVFDRTPAVSRTSIASKAIIDGSPLLLARLILMSEQYGDHQRFFNKVKNVALLTLVGVYLLLFIAIIVKVKLEIRRHLRAFC